MTSTSAPKETSSGIRCASSGLAEGEDTLRGRTDAEEMDEDEDEDRGALLCVRRGARPRRPRTGPEARAIDAEERVTDASMMPGALNKRAKRMDWSGGGGAVCSSQTHTQHTHTLWSLQPTPTT